MAIEFVKSSTEEVRYGNDLDIVDGVPAATFSGWVMRTGGSGTIFSTSKDGSPTVSTVLFKVRITSSGTIQFNGRDSTGDRSTNESTGSLTTDVWTHLAVVGDIANDDILFYFDGVLDSTDTHAWAGSTYDTGANANTSVGSGLLGGGPSDSMLDDVRIYQRGLSAKEILTIYTSRGKDDIYDSMSFRQMFREKAPGATTSVTDDVKGVGPNKYKGTGQNTPTYRDSELSYGY